MKFEDCVCGEACPVGPVGRGRYDERYRMSLGIVPPRHVNHVHVPISRGKRQRESLLDSRVRFPSSGAKMKETGSHEMGNW